jgi:hypothetical protein
VFVHHADHHANAHPFDVDAMLQKRVDGICKLFSRSLAGYRLRQDHERSGAKGKK